MPIFHERQARLRVGVSDGLRMISRRAVIAAGLLASGVAGAAPAWAAWKDLLNMLPTAAAMNSARQARGRSPISLAVQKIEDAAAQATNFDRYPVKITKMPGGTLASPAALLQHIRIDLNTFFDHSVSTIEAFTPADDADWKKPGSAPVGSVMLFRAYLGPLQEQGAVVTSATGPLKWIFTPVKIGLAQPGEHPVAGNREFGIVAVGAGGFELYTRAADRALAGLIDPSEGIVYGGADKLWRSWQAKVAAFVNSEGGQAAVVEPTTYKPSWEDVKSSGLFNR